MYPKIKSETGMNRRELQKIAVKLGRSEIVRNIKKESEKLRRTDNGMVRVADLVDTLLEEIRAPEDDK